MSEEIKSLKNYISTTKNEIFTTFKIETISNLIIYYEDLQQKVEQLENIIDVKKYDYDYLETLFSKSSKEEVLKAYTYKCEQLEKVTEARNEFEMKSMQLENIRKEAIEYINKMWLAKLTPGTVSDTKFDLLNILNKGE